MISTLPPELERGAGVPGFFEDRFESILGVDSPAGADRVADQGDPEGPGGFLSEYSRSRIPWALVRHSRPKRVVASLRLSTTSRRSSTRTTSGDCSTGIDQVLPERLRTPQAGHVGQVVEATALVEQFLVISALDALEVGPVEEVALEAVAQRRRRCPASRSGTIPHRRMRTMTRTCLVKIGS